MKKCKYIFYRVVFWYLAKILTKMLKIEMLVAIFPNSVFKNSICTDISASLIQNKKQKFSVKLDEFSIKLDE